MNFIFLTYVNRSGSTYLANLLDSSPKILACPEGDMLVSFLLEDPGQIFIFNEQIKSRLTEIFSADPKLHCWGDGRLFFPGLENASNNLEAFIKILINYKNQVKPEAEFILFKAERIIFLMRKILNVKTDTTIYFISIIRDPRSVYASQKRTYFPGSYQIMSEDPVKIAYYWQSYVRLNYFFKYEKFLIIKFEDMMNDFQASINKLSDFLKLELTDVSPERGNLLKRMPDFHIQIHENIQKKPVIQKIDEWKKELMPKEICIIEKITGKYFSKAGYIKLQTVKPGINIYLDIIIKLVKLSFSRISKKINFYNTHICK